jgi:nucleoside-diphosphate-sugar epimerase
MDRSENKNVLVTGGTGFVGSHLVELLLSKGYSVSCLARDPSQLRWLESLDVHIIKGDCSEPASLIPAVKNVSYVFHAAGLTKAKRSREYYEVNQFGTRNVLEACKEHNPELRKFIYVSSLGAAGPSEGRKPITESTTPGPVSDYGKSKLIAEKETLRFKDRFPVVILRPAAVYGPRDTDVYEFFRWAMRGLIVELSGGSRYVSFCFVKDVARALLSSAEMDTMSGSIYFVAEDVQYSWSEFREALFRTGRVTARTIKVPIYLAYLIGLVTEVASLFSNKPALTNRQKVREAVQNYWTCDPGKIERELGFRTECSLEEGLETTWKWYRDNGWL